MRSNSYIAELVAVAAGGLLAAWTSGCSVPDKVEVTPDGPALDAAPPVDGTPDDNAPDTTITMAPREFDDAGLAVFHFVSDDPTATFTCSVDGDSPVACTSPFSRSLADGSHGFLVRAADAAGNSDDTPAEHVWTIDTIAPTTRITMAPPAVDNSTMVGFAFESNEDTIVFECSLDGGAYAECQSGQPITGIGDGTHSFAVRAQDRAGNVDVSPAIHTWFVDTSTPDTTILAGPSGATSSQTAQFTFVSPDAGSGATFECRLDGGAFTACTSPWNLINLTAGTHTFAVRVRDSAANFDPSPATRTWTVDLTAPETTITLGPTGTIASASASFAFTSNEDDVTFECSVDGSAYGACASPVALTMLAQGAHAFAVRARDAANHVDATPASRTWTVDTAAPDIVFVTGPAQGATVGPRVTIGFTVSDGAVLCSLDAAPFAACTSPEAWNVSGGAHAFRVQATDAAGNVALATRSWTTACVAPDAAGAIGLLHLDSADQAQPNAVPGGAGATLGVDASVEPIDPTATAGRFGGALAFATGDLVAWPLAGPATVTPSVIAWVRPTDPAIATTIAATADGRFALRALPNTGATLRFSVTVDGRTATSAAVARDSWHHIATTVSAGTLRLWVDGARVDVVMASPEMPVELASVQLGGLFDGAIDEVWIGTGSLATDDAALADYCP